MRANSALVVGEALVDIVMVDGTDRVTPGGSPLNVAVGLARLGITTDLLAELGEDINGSVIRRHLNDSAVGVNHVKQIPSTCTAHAVIDTAGSASYDFQLSWTLSCDPGELPTVDILHVGSIGSWLPPGADRVLELMRSRPAVTIGTFDPNIRPSLIDDHVSVGRRVEALAREVDVVKLSDEDAEWLYPDESIEQVGDRYLSLGVSVFALTRGAAGSIVRTREHCVEQPAARVTVIDTIGAGDAFMSGMLFALATGDLLGELRPGLDKDALQWVAECAAASAGMVVAREGADPPLLSEFRASLSRPELLRFQARTGVFR